MRILVDAKNLALAEGTGIATYARNICRANQELGNHVEILYEFLVPSQPSDLEQELAFFDQQYSYGRSKIDDFATAAFVAGQLLWPRPMRGKQLHMKGFVETRPLQGRLPLFDQIVTAPLVYRKAQAYFGVRGRLLPVVADPMPDIVHWTTLTPIYVPGARNIYTIHDVIPLKLPYTTTDNRRRFLRLVRGAVKHAARIICVSETTKRDLLTIVPDAESKITNTSQSIAPLPVSLSRDADDARNVLRNLVGLERKQFFLFFAAIEPKKNVGRLIEAFLSSTSRYPLILVGKKAWLYEEELKPLSFLAAQAKLAGSKEHSSRVVHLEYMSSALLHEFVKAARAVLFPSLYEGFGLPILEAMSVGTPVMTSNTGAMAEVARPGTAILIDPLNIREMTQAIERLAEDDKLCSQLSCAGLARAAEFSWDCYKGSIRTAYEKAFA